MAAIAAVHDEAPRWHDTDWREVVGLRPAHPAVALTGSRRQPGRRRRVRRRSGAGLAAIDPLTIEPQLAGYGYLAAARAEFLRQLGHTDQARSAYDEALLLTQNAVERDFLTARLGCRRR